jgi:hypothetical protein
MVLASYAALAPEHRSHGKGSVAAASHSCSRHHPGAGDLTAAHRAFQGQRVDGRRRGADHVVELARNLAIEVPVERE